jgi:hypothetical protein
VDWRDRLLLAAPVIVLMTWLAGAVAAAETSEAERPAAKAETEFKPPPGYRTKKRGDKVVYCKKAAIPDSRLTAEKCYDERQLREIEFAMDQQRREIDQRRRICPTPTACS